MSPENDPAPRGRGLYKRDGETVAHDVAPVEGRTPFEHEAAL